MPRPTKLTPEVQEKIVTALRAGNYQETSATYAGISVPTFYGWMDRGRNEPGSIYSEFLEAVEKAKADAEVRDVALIDRAAADGNWQAAAWKLERKFPNRWGRVNRTEVTGADGGALKVEVDHKAALLDLLGLSDADSDDG
jgi:transposase